MEFLLKMNKYKLFRNIVNGIVFILFHLFLLLFLILLLVKTFLILDLLNNNVENFILNTLRDFDSVDIFFHMISICLISLCLGRLYNPRD